MTMRPTPSPPRSQARATSVTTVDHRGSKDRAGGSPARSLNLPTWASASVARGREKRSSQQTPTSGQPNQPASPPMSGPPLELDKSSTFCLGLTAYTRTACLLAFPITAEHSHIDGPWF
ncbi:hypothetical protein GGTG_06929 [Gaeumannomyces tritici R3-111a-1]|uniref:Uncharacterized protein n=1 Tax=Gaeumannomyces tritici (strain R3-111a-1) TaxID=644352 RepID=J3P082_GAET3|nr:hypothetical protein GGTG_06929 [Gaeumannomyces tritici R3-111a-1]EJT77015.1 hypothetical protein GGTG_06929 [Gaeumannomyces tritici R3-111a-1]